jgi:hypothetical protein
MKRLVVMRGNLITKKRLVVIQRRLLTSLKTVLIDLRTVLENQGRARISQRKILTIKAARGAPVIYGRRFIKTSLFSIDTL